MKAMAPLLLWRSIRSRMVVRKAVYAASDISPDAIGNSACFACPRHETCPLMGTL